MSKFARIQSFWKSLVSSSEKEDKKDKDKETRSKKKKKKKNSSTYVAKVKETYEKRDAEVKAATSASAVRAKSSEPLPEYVITKYSYCPSASDELQFKRGEVLHLQGLAMDGYANGTILTSNEDGSVTRGASGMVPVNYFEPLSADQVDQYRAAAAVGETSGVAETSGGDEEVEPGVIVADQVASMPSTEVLASKEMPRPPCKLEIVDIEGRPRSGTEPDTRLTPLSALDTEEPTPLGLAGQEELKGRNGDVGADDAAEVEDGQASPHSVEQHEVKVDTVREVEGDASVAEEAEGAAEPDVEAAAVPAAGEAPDAVAEEEAQSDPAVSSTPTQPQGQSGTDSSSPPPLPSRGGPSKPMLPTRTHRATVSGVAPMVSTGDAPPALPYRAPSNSGAPSLPSRTTSGDAAPPLPSREKPAIPPRGPRSNTISAPSRSSTPPGIVTSLVKADEPLQTFGLTEDEEEMLSVDEKVARLEAQMEEINKHMETTGNSREGVEKLKSGYANDAQQKAKLELQYEKLGQAMMHYRTQRMEVMRVLAGLRQQQAASKPEQAQSGSEEEGAAEQPESESEGQEAEKEGEEQGEEDGNEAAVEEVVVVGKKVVQVLYDWEPETDREVSAKQGDYATILRDDHSEWVCVMVNDQKGYIARSYLDL